MGRPYASDEVFETIGFCTFMFFIKRERERENNRDFYQEKLLVICDRTRLDSGTTGKKHKNKTAE